jgi:hypothetical protein
MHMENLVKATDKEYQIEEKFQVLLNQFEKEVEPYDKISAISALATPVGVVISIFLPLLFLHFVGRGQLSPSLAITGGPLIYWIVGGIVGTIFLSKLSLIYIDHQKHKISRTKYQPIAGVCMCDLSQLRSQVIKMEKSKTAGERIRHVKLINYYKHQMGW